MPPVPSTPPAQNASLRRLQNDGWNDAHSGPAVATKAHKKHKFSPANKDCAELNTDRLSDEEMVADDNWVGGFYMEAVSYTHLTLPTILLV